MKRVEPLGEAVAPDGTVLTLYRHDRDYVIRVDGQELMSTRRHHSEDVLAELVCAPLRERAGARVLIGGLGLGFTLRAALRSLAADAQVVVAEIVEEVIRWNRNPDYALAADALLDPRVDLRHDDVANVLQASGDGFDAVMLDVDNGAAPLTAKRNAGLYRAQGIRRAATALRPGGRLAYWSAAPDPAFEKALRGAGLTVEVVRARAHPGLKIWHTIYVASHVQAGIREWRRIRKKICPHAELAELSEYNFWWCDPLLSRPSSNERSEEAACGRHEKTPLTPLTLREDCRC